VKVEAVIAAGGRGTRFANNTRPKQFCQIAGKPILDWTIAVFDECEVVTAIILVVPTDMVSQTRDILHLDQYRKLKALVAGGAERQESVRNGLERVDADTDVVLVHDGVRALVSSDLITRVARCAARHGSAVPCLPIKETLKRAKPEGTITETLKREAGRALPGPDTPGIRCQGAAQGS
jgi:2-C-methyl-D-erythritol 4-phosphate cytidylyltransferase